MNDNSKIGSLKKDLETAERFTAKAEDETASAKACEQSVRLAWEEAKYKEQLAHSSVENGLQALTNNKQELKEILSALRTAQEVKRQAARHLNKIKSRSDKANRKLEAVLSKAEKNPDVDSVNARCERTKRHVAEAQDLLNQAKITMEQAVENVDALNDRLTESRNKLEQAVIDVEASGKAEITAKSETARLYSQLNDAVLRSSRALDLETKSKRAVEKARRSLKNKSRKAGVTVEGGSVFTGMYSGMINILITRPASIELIKVFERSLSQVSNMSIVSTGGSREKGAVIVVSVDEPVPLIDMLRANRHINQVQGYEKTNSIEVLLKSAPISD